MTFDLAAIRAQYPALSATDEGTPRLYFDNPAGTQVPVSVVERMSECMLQASANLGGYFKTSKLAGARAAMQDFLNAPSAAEIIFGQSMTALTFHIARSIGRALSPGDEIILSRMDHDANVEPWKLMARDHGLGVRWLEFDPQTFEFDTAAGTTAVTAIDTCAHPNPPASLPHAPTTTSSATCVWISEPWTSRRPRSSQSSRCPV